MVALIGAGDARRAAPRLPRPAALRARGSAGGAGAGESADRRSPTPRSSSAATRDAAAHDAAAREPEAEPSRVRARVVLPRAHGDPAGAVRAMRFAASAGGSAAELRLRARAARRPRARARPARARRAAPTCGALRDVPSYPQALTGLARIDAAGGDLERAAARLRRSTERLPLTTSLTLLGEVELRRRAGARPRAHLDARATRTRRTSRAAASRTPRRSCSRRTTASPRAGGGARPARLRRAPSIRSADALGWALTRAGRPRAGLAWARRALRTGSRDPMFRLHAGVRRAAPACPRGGALPDGGGEGGGGAVAAPGARGAS